MFSLGEAPPGLTAPLVSSPVTTETEQDDQGLPYRYWKTEDVLSSTIPRLRLNGFLGRGSTGTVYSGSWHGQDVAVKVVETEEPRARLRLESLWYAKISEKEPAKHVLPAFIGRFRHSLFDVLVLSKEGSALDSWDDLIPDERYVLPTCQGFFESTAHFRLELFSMVVVLHQAGLLHGDLEPRNVLRSTTGQLKLVDLSAASEHECAWRVVSSSWPVIFVI
jgi:serine/threonine protein kinase